MKAIITFLYDANIQMIKNIREFASIGYLNLRTVRRGYYWPRVSLPLVKAFTKDFKKSEILC